jgi:hypothetical protein
MSSVENIRRIKEIRKIKTERDTIVQNALACRTLQDGNIVTTGISNVQQMMLNDAILSFEVMVAEGYEQRLDKICYSYPPSGSSPIADFSLIEVMKNLKGRGASTFAECMEEVEIEYRRLEELPLIRYDVHMVLNVVPFEDFLPLTLSMGDATVQIRSTQELRTVLSNEDVLAEKRKIEKKVGFRYSLDNRIFLTVSLQARNAVYAGKIAVDLRDFVLALIDLSKHERSMPLLSSGPIGAIDSLDSTIGFILDEKSGYHGALYQSENLDDVTISIDRDAVIEATDKYSRASTDAQQIIRRAFSAYHQGITEKNPSFAFMYFWSSLEQILLKDDNLRHPDMLNRLYRVILNPSLLHEFEIGQLLELRNALIHDAAYHRVGPYHRSLLKLFTEPILWFFLYDISDFNKGQLDLFYNKFGCHKNEFKRPRSSDEEAAVYARIKKIRESAPLKVSN